MSSVSIMSIDRFQASGWPQEEDTRQGQTNRIGIVGSSAALEAAMEQAQIVAPTDSTVLISGETGTGKELFARLIHDLSRRSREPFIRLNCAAIPDGLLESELFGHEKGAFTSAFAPRVGRFEAAHRGTIFLDEIGDIPLGLQPKLLRVLQEHEFERLGSTRTTRVNVRVVTATNKDLSQLVENHEFRADLFYRLNVFPIELPPLRERREDIPFLVAHFVSKAAEHLRRPAPSIPPDALQALSNYSWPGNIRELENFTERAVILSGDGVLRIPPLKPRQGNAPESSTLRDVQRDHIIRVLEATGWTVGGRSGAAARLGLPRTTLIDKMKKLGIPQQKELHASDEPENTRAVSANIGEQDVAT